MLHIISLVLVAALAMPEVAGNDSREMERRTDNFRLPVDMPFDPKFWPTRGRRSQSRTGLDCSDLTDMILSLVPQDCLHLIDVEPAENLDYRLPAADKSFGKRQKKSRCAEMSDFLWTNGKNRLLKPEEKKDVFWVTRGKRNSA